jgi:hypothetical protein
MPNRLARMTLLAALAMLAGSATAAMAQEGQRLSAAELRRQAVGQTLLRYRPGPAGSRLSTEILLQAGGRFTQSPRAWHRQRPPSASGSYTIRPDGRVCLRYSGYPPAAALCQRVSRRDGQLVIESD